MDIINAAESALKSRLDEYAFEINSCIQLQSEKGSLDRLLSLVSKYSHAAAQMNTLDMIKKQLVAASPNPDPEVTEENEG